jgi:lysophospholipase L1-like esterase
MPPDPAKPLTNLFVLGDSISIHYGPDLERFVSGVFSYSRKNPPPNADVEASLNSATSLHGPNGGDSSMVLEYLRYRRAEDPIPEGILLLNCGLHDIKTSVETGKLQIGPEDYEQNLRLILSEANAMNLQTAWVRTTPVIDEIHNSQSSSFHRFARDVERYNAIADRVMTSANIPILDLHGFTAHFLPDGYCDHVHFTPAVRALQAAFLAGALLHRKP